MFHKSKITALAALNLFAMTSAFLPQAHAECASVNAASLQSIEASWLKVPHLCKARGFNADPQAPSLERHAPATLAIYNSFVL